MTGIVKTATALHIAKKYKEAEQQYLKALNIEEDKNVRYVLGLLYSQTKQYIKAINQLEKTLPYHTNNSAFFNALAICYQKLGHNKVAEHMIDIAISLDTKNKNYCNRKSKILISANKIDNSLNISLNCITNHPTFFPAYQSYIVACNIKLRPDWGLRIMKKALISIPNNPDVIFGLAETYYNTGKYKKAMMLFHIISTQNYKKMECSNNMGNIEREFGNLKLAKNFYLQADTLSPNDPIVMWNISLLHLLNGDYFKGWKKYDNRLLLTTNISSLDCIPIWKGENLNKKSIIIISEQGLGDEILFSSSYKTILKQAKETIILCDDRLKSTFLKSFPESIIIKNNDSNVISKINCDLRIHAGSIFQYTDIKQNGKKYLLPSKDISLDLKNRFNIGFSWKGGTTYNQMKKRSIQLRYWTKLLNNTSYHFYCLQHNISKIDKKTLSKCSNNVHFIETVSSSNSLEDTINLISKLDLVISVTNTNVHIAGALGVKTWCLSPHNPDWPWGVTGKQCHWYDSVEILRKKSDSWNSVFIEIDKKLSMLQYVK